MINKLGSKVYGVLVLVLALTIAPIFIRNEYYLHVLIMILLNIVIASSFRLIMTMGLVSCAHSAFIAIGGYASALLVMKLGVNFWVGLTSGMLAALIVSVLLGLVVLRLKGTYFFLASFAFTEVVMLIFTRWTNPFGGAAGLMFIPLPDPITIPGLLTVAFDNKQSLYFLALLLAAISMLVMYKLDEGRMGKIWTGIAQSDQLAASVGVNVRLYKVLAFAIGSSFAAMVGSFQAHYFSHIHPGGFGFFMLINYLIFVIVGGKDKFVGAVVGTVLMTLVGEYLSFYEFLTLYQTIVYGIVLILFVLFLPNGLISLLPRGQPENSH